MPFLRRANLDPKLLAKHDKEYKDKIRQALSNPGLLKEQLDHLRVELKNVGRPKQYRLDTPPKPGAILLAVPEQAVKKRLAKNKAPKGAGGRS